MKRISHIACIALLITGSAAAVAQTAATQTTAPAVAPITSAAPATKAAPAGYAGPSGAPLMTAKDLLANGKDDQYVRLKGKLTSHKGDENYEFTDASGKITVEIDADRFPAGVTVDHNTLVELTGEFDKEMFGDSTVDVEQIKVVAQ
jgi:uncharacterized protein (TIGR00156 family)